MQKVELDLTPTQCCGGASRVSSSWREFGIASSFTRSASLRKQASALRIEALESEPCDLSLSHCMTAGLLSNVIAQPD